MKKLLLCLTLSAILVSFSSTELNAQKTIINLSSREEPPKKILEAIDEFDSQLIIAPGFEDDMIVEIWNVKGTWHAYISFVTRFINDAWGGFRMPGRAILTLNAGGKIKDSAITYPFGN